jgi:hypothetical protein
MRSGADNDSPMLHRLDYPAKFHRRGSPVTVTLRALVMIER